MSLPPIQKLDFSSIPNVDDDEEDYSPTGEEDASDEDVLFDKSPISSKNNKKTKKNPFKVEELDLSDSNDENETDSRTPNKKRKKKEEDLLGDGENLVIREYLDENRLKEETGQEDLTKVEYLEIIIDTTENCAGDLGSKMPSLKQLKLNSSTLTSLRDLGTSLKGLSILWASRCDLSDLDGLMALPNLKEIYLSFNNISDISPLGFLDQIEIIDLEANQIKDLEQVSFLGDCANLFSLTLEGNPIGAFEDYAEKVAEYIPTLKYLDDKDIQSYLTAQKLDLRKKSSKDKKKVTISQQNPEIIPNPELPLPSQEPKISNPLTNLEREMQFLHKSIKFSKIDLVDSDAVAQEPIIISASKKKNSLVDLEDLLQKSKDVLKRPQTARGYLTARPRSSLGNSTSRNLHTSASTSRNFENQIPLSARALQKRPLTAKTGAKNSNTGFFTARSSFNGGNFGAGPSTAVGAVKEFDFEKFGGLTGKAPDSSSELTFGSPLAIVGSPAKSLLNRKKKKKEDEEKELLKEKEKELSKEQEQEGSIDDNTINNNNSKKNAVLDKEKERDRDNMDDEIFDAVFCFKVKTAEKGMSMDQENF